MLSNTATPKYYALFRDRVYRGEIPVNQEISMEMNRIENLIQNPMYYFDNDAVEGWVEFCEGEMTLTDGGDLKLLDSFKLWGEEIFGWYYYETRTQFVPSDIPGQPGRYVTKRILKRLTVKQYLIVARGAAKSMYASLLQAYFLIIDTSTTQQITTSPTMKQSEEIMAPIRTAIARARGPVMNFLTMGSLQNTTGDRAKRQKVASTKAGIQNFITNSIIEVRPMSINKLQGLRPKVTTIDEWLSGDTKDDVVGACEQGASKLEDYLIVATSSEGTVRNGIGDSIKMELMSILRGEYLAPHISIWYYKLDDIKEVGDPNMWIKANPNIGQTVSYATYEKDVERAEKNPSVRNDILAKRFGIPMEGYTYFFTYGETLPHPKRHYWQMECALGADLSQGDDFCAFTLMFPLTDGSFGIKTRSYITDRTLCKLNAAARVKYDEFMREGTLIVFEGSVLDMDQVYEDVEQWIYDNAYDVRSFGYDPYNAEDFVKRWCQENGAYAVTKVPQGAKTESVPLGELKQLAEDRALRFDEALMSYAMGNCITLQDTNGNRKLYKMRYSEKIDNVAAMMDAYFSYKKFKENFG